MHRLYLQIYGTLLGILILFGVLAAVLWLLALQGLEDTALFEGFGAVAGELLPGPDQRVEELQSTLERIGRHLPGIDLNVRGPDGALLAGVGASLPAPRPDRTESGWMLSRERGATVALRLPDGRWLVARYVHARRAHAWPGLVILGLLALAIGVGAYPITRRLTRRLERLKTRVDELGAGDLSARVEVEGGDEVASLARSFNRAAERIERLVRAQRSVLAGASHELRSPLARLSVAAELAASQERPEIRARMARDIAELDELIGELLLASRLDAGDTQDTREEVDLLALLAEEAARTGASVSGEPVTIEGDPRLLRRLVRNLLENAERYASKSPIEASVARAGAAGAVIRVEDRGPGVPAEERERIFEPFYRPSGAGRTTDKGIGLGLALVRQIARHHHGDARCLPRDGGGTSFEVGLRVD